MKNEEARDIKAMEKPAGQNDSVSDQGLRQFVGYTMKRAFLDIRDDLIVTLAPLGLRVMTFSALSIVVENPDLSQSQLAQSLRIERSGVVVLVDELEMANLILRNPVQGDRRSYALRATLKGRRLWKQAERKVQAHEKALLAELSDEEQKILNALLCRIGSGSSISNLIERSRFIEAMVFTLCKTLSLKTVQPGCSWFPIE